MYLLYYFLDLIFISGIIIYGGLDGIKISK